jgi:thioredoxin reductase (NADPH)
MPPLVHIRSTFLLYTHLASYVSSNALETNSLLRGSYDTIDTSESSDRDDLEDEIDIGIDDDMGRSGIDFMASRGSKKFQLPHITMDTESGDHGGVDESREQFDLLVIGGGSAGLSVVKSFTQELMQIHSTHRKHHYRQPKVAIADFVEPTPIHGNSWGVGGTCLLVGCAPKKLMHVASRFAGHEDKTKEDLLRRFGWQNPDTDMNRTHDFGSFLGEVRYHLDTLSENQANQLEGTPGVSFFKRTKVSFTEPSEFPTTLGMQGFRLDTYQKAAGDAPGLDPRPVATMYAEAAVVVIAVGSRPRKHDQLMTLGGTNVISSDDFFHLLEKDPRNVVVIGGGYTALELASALKGLDPTRNVTLAYRKSLLKGFEPWLGEAVRSSMEALPGGGVKFERITIEELIAQGRHKDTTVVLAAGRQGNAGGLDLPAPFNSSLDESGRLRVCYEPGMENSIEYVDAQGGTACASNVFAVGDVVSGLPELATRARLEGSRIGRTAARLLFSDAAPVTAADNLELNGLPSVLFAPLELFDWKAPGYEGRPIVAPPCPDGKCTFKEETPVSEGGASPGDMTPEKLLQLPLAWAPLSWAQQDRDLGKPVFSDWIAESIPPSLMNCGIVVVRHVEGRIVRLSLAHPHASEVGQGLVWGLEAWWRSGKVHVTSEALERGAARLKENDALAEGCQEASSLVPRTFSYKLPPVQGEPATPRSGRSSVVEKAISSVESMFLQASLSDSVVEHGQGWRISGKAEGLRGNLTEFKIYAPHADALGLGLAISELSQTVSGKGSSKRGRSTRVLPPAYPIHPTLGESLTQRPSDKSSESAVTGPPTCCG